MEWRLGVEEGKSDSGGDNGEHEYVALALSDASAEYGDNV